MKYLLQIALVAQLLFLSAGSYACICSDSNTFEENIKIYPFIAHVKILDRFVKDDTVMVNGKMRIGYGHEGDVEIGILELFKGKPVKSIRQYSIRTSCDIGVNVGEEWMIFARYDTASKKFYIGACSPSSRLRNQKGEQRWEWFVSGTTLNSLRKAFKHPLPENGYADGIQKSYYQNGQLEWEAAYTHHKINGNRKIYFADGKLYIDENFKNDEQHDSYRRYNNAGQLVEEGMYENGQCLRSKWWSDYTTDPLSGHFIKGSDYKAKPEAPWLQRESYWRDSSYSWDKTYHKNGNTKREDVYDYKGDSLVSKTYFESGKINYMTTHHWKQKKEYYRQWDEKGRLEMDRVYIDGKLVESRRFD